MPHKQKKNAEEKAKIVRQYLQGEISITAAELGEVDRATIRKWIRTYETEGISGFVYERNKAYSPEIKRKAVADNPNAHPLFHSDRGFQYKNRTFHAKLEAAGMTQSMSRVAHCIDNGPMEGFWGILKRERYYGRRFTSKEELVDMIHTYIAYYNNCRVQRNLGILTPMEKHQKFLIAA